MSLRHTDEQVQFLNAALYSDQHLLLRSTAGSGKTTMLVEAASLLTNPERAMYFTYNRHATSDVQGRLPVGMKARNVHAHGFALLSQEAERLGHQINVDDQKTTELLHRLPFEWMNETLLPVLNLAWDTWREERLTFQQNDLELVAQLIGWNDHCPAEASNRHWLSQLQKTFRRLRELSLSDWQMNARLDYTDMLWLPLELGLGRQSIQTAIVDEAQDFSPLRTAFVAHLAGLRTGKGRLIAAGDPEQLIYGYAMTQKGSLWSLAEQLGALELPLSTSFRCPIIVTTLAAKLSSFIRPAPKAPAGQLLHVPAEPAYMPPEGTTFLARHNGTLLNFAHLMLEQGRSASLADPALSRLLTGIIRHVLPDGISVQDIPEHLAMTNLNPPLSAALFHIAARQGSHLNQESLLQTIQRLTDPQAHSLDLYFTVHKAKGREWRDVTILQPEDFCFQPTTEEAEACVTFVAITRSKHTLRLAYGPAAWARGELVGCETLEPESKQQLLQNPLPGAGKGRQLNEVQSEAPSPLMQPAPVTYRPNIPNDQGWPDLAVAPGPTIRVDLLRSHLLTLQRLTTRPALHRYLGRQLDLIAERPGGAWISHNPQLLSLTRQYTRADAFAIPTGPAADHAVHLIQLQPGGTRAVILQIPPDLNSPDTVILTLPSGEQLEFSRADGEPVDRPFTPESPRLHHRELKR